MQDDFKFFKLGLPSRLLVAGGLFAAGVALELAVPQSRIPGMIVALAGWIPLMLRKVTNKPDDQGLEEWRPVPMSEVDRLEDALCESRKLRRRTKSLSTTMALSFGVFALVIVIGISSAMGRSDLALIVENTAIFLAPALVFGKVNVFTPSEIVMKMGCFHALLVETLPETVAVAPYIRFDKDKSGADCPEDLRLLYELKRSPADLVGIQLQAAINDGPRGPVPYMYAVVLTKGKEGPSYKLAQKVEAKGYVVEAGGDDEYGTVVIRQKTSGGGYETKVPDCTKLLAVCMKLLVSLG
jgi:hypothetical protein